MGIEVFRATTEEDREAIYRFRYTVYVEEMGRYKDTADHAGRRLVEPEDGHSWLYGAREDGEVVATCRMTVGSDGFSARQIDQYSLGPWVDEVPAELLAIGERLMVSPRLRGSPVAADVLGLQGADMAEGGVRIVFGDCEPHLLSLNLSIGCRPYADRNINSSDAGYLIPLVSFVGGIEGLAEAIGARSADGRPCLPGCIERALAHGGAVSSALLGGPDAYWREVRAALARLEQERLHVFAGFDAEEVQRCVSRSNIVECQPGDRILKKGGSSRNLFVVLDGILEVRDDDRVVNVLTAGDVFGEMAFLLELPRQLDVYAATANVRVLSMSDGTLRKLIAEEPTVTAKLLLNISKMLCGRLIKADLAVST
jgi:hypothetical protein